MRLIEKLSRLLVVAAVFFMLAGTAVSCIKDDPANPVNNHRPSQGGDDGNQNGGNDENDGNGNNGSEDDGNGNNNGTNEEEVAPIVGVWLRSDGVEKLMFGKDGEYAAYLYANVGDSDGRATDETRTDEGCENAGAGNEGNRDEGAGDEGWREYERGHYIYHDLSRKVWIEIEGEYEDRGCEYKCVFDKDGNLTLWTLDNKWRRFRKI